MLQREGLRLQVCQIKARHVNPNVSSYTASVYMKVQGGFYINVGTTGAGYFVLSGTKYATFRC